MKFFIQFFLCGIFTSFLFPPYFLIPIGFIVFPYIIYLFNHKEYLLLNYYYHFISGFLYGLGFFFIYLGWITEPFLLDDLTKSYSIFSYLLIIYCSIFFGCIFLILKYFSKISIKFFIFPTLIVIGEFICANLSYGFPWFSFSLIHSGNIFGTSIIFYLGTYGLSYTTVLIFLFPTIFLFKELKNKKLLLIFYFIILTILFCLTISRLKVIDKTDDNNFSIALAQLNFPINQKLSEDDKKINYNYIMDVIKKNKSNILIFAENNYPFLMDEKSIKHFQDSMQPQTNLIIGSTRKELDKFYNSLFLIDKQTFDKFDKQILVPFGEFIPFRYLFSFMEFIAGSVDFTIGTDKRRLILNDKINILPVICYEIIYFWDLLNEDNINSNVVINLTNDSWFGKFSGPYQHFYFTKLRAAEFNKLLIRVSNNGVSAIIDNYGNIINFVGLNKQEIMNIQIQIPNATINYRKYHRIITFLIFLTFLVGLLLNRKNAF